MKILSVLILTCLFFTRSFGQDSSTVVYFDFDKHEIRPAEKTKLDKLISDIKAGNIAGNILVKGHCDVTGPDEYNEVLARQRTFAVHEYLLNNGVPKTSVSIESFGERVPVNDNRTKAERQLNRRVEISWSLQKPVELPKEEPKEKEPQLPVKDFSKTAIDTVKEGDVLRLRNINFYGGRHTFLPTAIIPLEELLDVMKANPTLVIEIQGHICCRIGSPEDGADFDANDTNLSRNRARAVYDYLVENGIDKKRMSYKGFAGLVPLVNPEYTEADRTANRRVEIKIVKK
jgi:outer membrane protein OmpA-like peptidoglycan-associated protein